MPLPCAATGRPPWALGPRLWLKRCLGTSGLGFALVGQGESQRLQEGAPCTTPSGADSPLQALWGAKVFGVKVGLTQPHCWLAGGLQPSPGCQSNESLPQGFWGKGHCESLRSTVLGPTWAPGKEALVP